MSKINFTACMAGTRKTPGENNDFGAWYGGGAFSCRASTGASAPSYLYVKDCGSENGRGAYATYGSSEAVTITTSILDQGTTSLWVAWIEVGTTTFDKCDFNCGGSLFQVGTATLWRAATGS
jgi:hypothetical protein